VTRKGIFASKEYSKCMEKYLTSQDRYITIVLCELFRKKMLSLAAFIIMRIITIFIDNRMIVVYNPY